MIYKRGNQWHMDVMILGVRYRESLGTTAGAGKHQHSLELFALQQIKQQGRL